MAANSSRRRTEPELCGCKDQNLGHIVQAVYAPLRIEPPGTRFLTIKPKNSSEDRIECEISEIAFAEKPSYQALSYRWGDKVAGESILVNGVEWRVKQNLLDALYYLRSQSGGGGGEGGGGGLYWIDAICINQADKDECSAQVKLMRTIFSRASAVVVWLGNKYQKYAPMLSQTKALEQKQDEGARHLGEGVPARITTDEGDAIEAAETKQLSGRLLAKDLYSDEYWKRVWIVQEVGLAEKLIVCVGHYPADWDCFIRFLTVQNLGTEGPIKLHEQRRERHEGRSTLLRLFDDYKYSQCENRKDKVYGLLGLARDARFFPVDYSKTVFEIWKDVMEFANARELFSSDQVIATGGLVKYLLMGTQCELLPQMLREHVTVEEAVGLNDEAKIFKVPAKALGCVKYIGSRLDEIVSDPFKQELWEDMVQRHNREDSAAHAESDQLLRAVVNPKGPDLTKTCFTHNSAVQWAANHSAKSRELDWWHRDSVEKLQAMSRAQQNESNSYTKEESPTNGAHLYQLDCFFVRRVGRMGIASNQVQLGDLICFVASSRMAIILRPKIEGHLWTLRAVGTALLAEDFKDLSPEMHARRFEDFPDPFRSSDANLTVQLDATFVFLLLESERIFKGLKG